jgi:hypothetical protein
MKNEMMLKIILPINKVGVQVYLTNLTYDWPNNDEYDQNAQLKL